MQIKLINTSQIETNNGQISGLPKNPRFIKDESYKKLLKSVQEFPEMLELREVIVYPLNRKFVAIAGNMRVRVCREMKLPDVPCKVLAKNTPVEKLIEIAIKDNNSFGSYDWDILANEWTDYPLDDWGVDLPDEWLRADKQSFDFADDSEQKNSHTDERNIDKDRYPIPLVVDKITMNKWIKFKESIDTQSDSEAFCELIKAL